MYENIEKDAREGGRRGEGGQERGKAKIWTHFFETPPQQNVRIELNT